MTSLSDFGRLDEEPPDDRHSRLVLADFFKEEGDPRELILRAACAIQREVAGVALPDRFDAFWTESPGWKAAATELEWLSVAPKDTRRFRARYNRLLRGDIPLDLENLEPTLRLQYDLQVRLLDSLGLTEDGGITAIDGKWYPLPAFDDVLAKMQLPELQTKLSQGFDTLLVVPFGLSLERFLDAWREGLRRNADTLRSDGEFNPDHPLSIWNGYRTEPLVYDPQSLAADHGGRTKEQILAEDGRGWDVLLVEGALQNLPRQGRGQTVGGRRQLECGWSPSAYLAELSTQAEAGLTPESYILQFLDAIERAGRVFDAETYSFLPGTFLPTSSDVPSAGWFPVFGRAHLGRGGPGNRVPYVGVRAAVRVG